MSVNAIPKGYHTITPYFSVRDAHGLVDFLKRAFDAVVEIHNMPDGSVLNAQAQVGDSMILIGQAPKDHPADQFYGDRMGAVRDLAEKQWWIATHKEEMTRRAARPRG